MLLQVFANLHLEFEDFTPPASKADAVILAGDIHIGTRGVEWAKRTFPDRPVLYVAGNHEYYRQEMDTLNQRLHAAAEGSTVRVLNLDRCEIDGVVFLGAPLWTDFNLFGRPGAGMAICDEMLMDFRLIRSWKAQAAVGAPKALHAPLFRAEDAALLHAQTLRWLEKELDDLAGSGKRVVVITHHAPSIESVSGQYKSSPISSGFASNLDNLVIRAGAALWVHGHVHSSGEYRLGETLVVHNTRGYPQERRTGFNPHKVVEI